MIKWTNIIYEIDQDVPQPFVPNPKFQSHHQPSRKPSTATQLDRKGMQNLKYNPASAQCSQSYLVHCLNRGDCVWARFSCLVQMVTSQNLVFNMSD